MWFGHRRRTWCSVKCRRLYAISPRKPPRDKTTAPVRCRRSSEVPTTTGSSSCHPHSAGHNNMFVKKSSTRSVGHTKLYFILSRSCRCSIYYLIHKEYCWGVRKSLSYTTYYNKMFGTHMNIIMYVILYKHLELIVFGQPFSAPIHNTFASCRQTIIIV